MKILYSLDDYRVEGFLETLPVSCCNSFNEFAAIRGKILLAFDFGNSFAVSESQIIKEALAKPRFQFSSLVEHRIIESSWIRAATRIVLAIERNLPQPEAIAIRASSSGRVCPSIDSGIELDIKYRHVLSAFNTISIFGFSSERATSLRLYLFAHFQNPEN